MLVLGISAGKPHRLQQWLKFFGARLSFVPFPHFEGQTFDYVYICVHSCVWTWRFGWKNRNLPVATNVSQRGICHRCVSTPICQPPPFQPLQLPCALATPCNVRCDHISKVWCCNETISFKMTEACFQDLGSIGRSPHGLSIHPSLTLPPSPSS